MILNRENDVTNDDNDVTDIVSALGTELASHSFSPRDTINHSHLKYQPSPKIFSHLLSAKL